VTPQDPKARAQAVRREKQRKLIAQAGRYIGMATQIPFTIVAGYYLGYWLDTKFGTTYLRVVILILAIIGVFTQLIRQVLRDQKSK
jgi:membrane protein DedA with SNARE-associated domain